MRRAVYEEIISCDVKGRSNNPKETVAENAARSEKVRSFVIPGEYTIQGSQGVEFPDAPRTINIMAAYVSDDWVWAVTDFSRLVTMHVISRDEIWKKSDLEPKSEVGYLYMLLGHTKQ